MRPVTQVALQNDRVLSVIWELALLCGVLSPLVHARTGGGVLRARCARGEGKAP